MVYGTGKTRPILWGAGLALAAAGVGCVNSPDPTPTAGDPRVGEEVYRIFCKRVARDAYPNEATGLRFNAPCERGDAALDTTNADPRFVATVKRRSELVAALDQVFGDAPVQGMTESFLKTTSSDQGELDKFLQNMIPFYDDGTTPSATRAIAAMAKQLAEPTDPRAQQVLAKLADLSKRQGYRPLGQSLAATKPMLSYPRLDDVSEKLLGLLGKGGKGNDVFLKLLEAATLELADDSKNIANADSSLRVATDLMFRTLRQLNVEVPADAAADWLPPAYLELENKAKAPQYFVRRADDGTALGSDGKVTPFPVAGRADTLPANVARDPAGRLPTFSYGNATETLLAALLREQKPLLQRKAPGQGSTVEKLLRGLRPLLGSQGSRTYSFTSKRQYTFNGPNVNESPLLDLLHSVASLLAFPETESVLTVLTELLDKYESDANGTVYAGLAIDRFADMDNKAKVLGWDGTANTKSEFWDDLIHIGQRMLEPGREGQLEAVLRSFGEPSAVAQTSLLAKFMQNKDQVTYNGAPLKIGTDGKYVAADADKMNSEIKTQFQVPVDRTMPDVGMNRSLFQRLVSTINATNGASNCNKEGATLPVQGPLGTLTFPNADALQMAVAGCAQDPAHTGRTTYAACAFVKQPNGAVTQMRSIIGLGEARIQDSQLVCAAKFNNQDIGLTQETNSQIKGFTLKPTAQAISRYVMAPRTDFIKGLFDPFNTKYNVPLVEYEPDLLFALEARQDDITLNGKSASFLDASQDLTKAFDGHEIMTDVTTVYDDPKYPSGYMFADLLSTLHMHWSSPRADDCPAKVAAGNEGCTQRLDSTKPFFSNQSNLVSYEPILINAIQNERLGALLQTATARLKTIFVAVDATTGRPSVVPANTAGAKDGISVLSDFLKFAITPMTDPLKKLDGTPIVKSDGTPMMLAYRDGSVATHTNTCVPATDMNGTVTCQDGRGRYMPQTTPLYLLLDALAKIDTVWARPENADRHAKWLEGRSELIDTLLTVDRDDTDPNAPVYRMHDQRGRALTVALLTWLRGTMLTDKHPRSGDRVDWAIGANGLAKRLADTLSHPLVAYGLDLFDIVWDDAAAGDELAAMNTYLMDFDNNESAFLGIALAAADSLEFADREPNVAPVVQFGALAVAPNALASIAQNGAAPDVANGAANKNLELTRSVALLPAYKGMAGLSPLSKILKNAVIAGPSGRAPLEVIFDAIADVNRQDATQPTTVPFSFEDNRLVFKNLESFMSDKDRGLERLYTVIQGRSLTSTKAP